MATVVLERVSKTYGGGVDAVRGVSLSVADGEFVVLVGPSGCGKSTTLRMIAGLEEIGAGTISIDGRVVNDVPPKDRDVAMVFQNYALYPHMTVRENMSFGLRLRKRPAADIESRVREAADILGIADLLDRRPSALSGGQRQRVAVGRAIVRHPRVFLFDEPLSNLDARMRVQMRAELRRLHGRLRATMIYVTHDQVEAMTLGDRVVVMKDGRIRQAAPPSEVYRLPADLFVAGFIGSPPMNVVRGELARGPDGPLFRAEGLVAPLAGVVPPALASRPDGPVALGLRPEDIEVEGRRADDPAPAAIWNVRLEWIEPTGADAYWNLAAGSQTLVARANPAVRGEPGREYAIELRMDRARFFDPESGEALA